jgi:hypothetical protein
MHSSLFAARLAATRAEMASCRMTFRALRFNATATVAAAPAAAAASAPSPASSSNTSAPAKSTTTTPDLSKAPKVDVGRIGNASARTATFVPRERRNIPGAGTVKPLYGAPPPGEEYPLHPDYCCTAPSPLPNQVSSIRPEEYPFVPSYMRNDTDAATVASAATVPVGERFGVGMANTKSASTVKRNNWFVWLWFSRKPLWLRALTFSTVLLVLWEQRTAAVSQPLMDLAGVDLPDTRAERYKARMALAEYRKQKAAEEAAAASSGVNEVQPPTKPS